MRPRSPFELALRVAGVLLMLFMFLSGLVITVFAAILLVAGGSATETYGVGLTILVLGAAATVLTGAGLFHYLRPRQRAA
jgi:hypothetical protein